MKFKTRMQTYAFMFPQKFKIHLQQNLKENASYSKLRHIRMLQEIDARIRNEKNLPQSDIKTTKRKKMRQT